LKHQALTGVEKPVENVDNYLQNFYLLVLCNFLKPV